MASQALPVACWAWLLARLSHVDEIDLSLKVFPEAAWRSLTVSVSPKDSLKNVLSELTLLWDRATTMSSPGASPWRMVLGGESGDSCADADSTIGSLCLTVNMQGDGCRSAAITFDETHHEPNWVAELLQQFRRVCDLPVHLVGGVDWQWLDGVQYRRMVCDWNDTASDAPIEQCLHDLVRAQALRTPRALALEYAGECLSYAQLETCTDALSLTLWEHGVRPGQLVPLLALRSFELVVGVLGILKCGAAYVPIEPSWPEAQKQLVLADCEATLIVAQQATIAYAPTSNCKIVLIELEARQASHAPHMGTPDDLACVMYTSGSTGAPKGALINHRSLVNNILWLQRHWPLAAHDRMLQKTPFHFDVSIKELLWPLCAGASVVLAHPGAHVDLRELKRLILDGGITVCHFVPSMLQRFLDELGARRCAQLTLVMCGAEVLPPRLKQRFFEYFSATLLHLYGPTEAAISVTGMACQPGTQTGSVVPLGRAMDNVQIYLLDRAGQPVPPHTPGEIFIGGVAVARGYLKRPLLQDERFVPDRFGAHGNHSAKLYRTGDLARYTDDGILEFIGRKDRQVKVGGARVELRDIELTLQAHPQLKCVAASATQDARGDKRVTAYVVPFGEPHPTALELRQYCCCHMPSFMVPAAFVVLNELPLLATGKVNYQALGGVAAHPLFESARSRVIFGGAPITPHDLPKWLPSSYETFHERVSDPQYPCFLGSGAERRGELFYTVVDHSTLHILPHTLAAFLLAAQSAPSERRNLTVFFEPDKTCQSHASYRARFWAVLQYLNGCDPAPWPSQLPRDNDNWAWEFAFAGQGIFVFGAAPSYQQRSSRNLGPGMVMLMQPRSSFFGLDGHTERGIQARAVTRERLAAWDAMPSHPDLGAYGDPNNREWKQYFLPDDNQAANGACPFSLIRS